MYRVTKTVLGSDTGVKWRIINDRPRSGAENMAVDEAILEAVVNQSSPPVIRFYSWISPCVTIGYFQRMYEAIDVDAVDANSFDLVRRPTGGRAILHSDELTYSVTAPLSEFDECKSVLETYLKINCGLAMGFRDYGIEVELAPADDQDVRTPEALLSSLKYVSQSQVFRPHVKSAACFDTPAPYELVFHGRKVAGSAQTRRREVLLQQGSIPFSMDYDLMKKLFRLSCQEAEALARGTVAVRDVIQEADPIRLSHHLADGIVKALDVQTENSDLTTGEAEKASELLEEKYRRHEWTFKR